MEIITGYTGENHVTSADDASLYRGILGQSDYVLDVGNKFAATIIDNNTIRIADGDLIIQGHQARIRANDYEEVTIDNGTPGEKRNDLIVARYQKNTTTGIESITLEVVKGTPGATAVDPDIVQEDLSTGGTQRDFVLYRVSLNGLVLENITSLFTVLPNLKDFNSHLAESAQLGIYGISAAQSIPHSYTEYTRIILNKVDRAADFCELTEDGGIKILKSGLYLVTFICAFAHNPNGRRQIGISGAQPIMVQPVSQTDAQTRLSLTYPIYRNNGDIVYDTALQTSGGALDLYSTGTQVLIAKLG